jgi:peptidoglycan/LPS O-acetylase OafA/YrhL
MVPRRGKRFHAARLRGGYLRCQTANLFWTDARLQPGAAGRQAAAVQLRSLPHAVARWVRALSVRSYAVYLVHLSVLEIVSQWHARLGLSALWCTAIATVSIFGLSYGLNRFAEMPIILRRPAEFPASPRVLRARLV